VIITNKFQIYIRNNQSNYINEIIEKINIERETTNSFEEIGKEASSIGITIKIYDENMNELFHTTKGNTGRGKGGKYTETTYSLKDNLGSVVLGKRGNYIYQMQDLNYLNTINKSLIFIGLGMVLISVLVSYFVAKHISDPINQLKNQTAQISNEKYINVHSKTNTFEIQELANSINDLSMKLKKQQSIKKRLARDYAHELKTPLAALQSNIEGMIDKVIPINDEKLEVLRSETIRINKLVDQINKIVIVNDNKTLNQTTFELSELVKSIIGSYETKIKSKDLKLIIELNEVIIKADRDMIAQVITNLVSNAVKYTNKGFIKIRLEKLDEIIHLTIEDSGVGISQNDIPYIFDHLFRSDESRSQKIEGFGIGLAVAKEIIEQHEGTIEVISEENKGSKFIIKLKSF
ncbi:MAG: HAMP domain-containing histidine kinase, partial [Acholeplasmataceae bacterium]|nr:HAMP domain-containing histidine kinase [Acholeplasmataceae bacterium]